MEWLRYMYIFPFQNVFLSFLHFSKYSFPVFSLYCLNSRYWAEFWNLTSIILRTFKFFFINEQKGRWIVSHRPQFVGGMKRWFWPNLMSTRGVPTQARTWWTQSPTDTVNTTTTGMESITTSKSRKTRQSKSFFTKSK